MNINYKNAKDNTLCAAKGDSLVFDYEEILIGIESAREDVRCGRYIVGRSFIENLRKKFCDL